MAGASAVLSDAVADPGLPVEALYEVCWPEDAMPSQQVTLTFEPKKVFFEPSTGVSNSTARCLREVASSYPFSTKPQGSVLVKPPAVAPDGWKILGFVKLLSPSRSLGDRGLLDPSSLVHACLGQGAGSFRPSAVFEVRFSPVLAVNLVGGALSEKERCVEAALGATSWPSTRSFNLSFPASSASVAQGTRPEIYFEPATERLEPIGFDAVRESFSNKKSAVGNCWDQAIARRARISGGRTVRFQSRGGKVKAWMVKNASDGQAGAADYLLDVCLVDVVQSMQFGREGDGVYTWVFAERV